MVTEVIGNTDTAKSPLPLNNPNYRYRNLLTVLNQFK